MSNTPYAGQNSHITTGGQSVIAVPVNPGGGVIQNPLLASDQGIAGAEPLYVDIVSTCPTAAQGPTQFVVQPGGTWAVIPNQTTATYVNASTSGHRFTVTWWLSST